MSWKRNENQDKEKCKWCLETGGVHEANCPYLVGYFKGADSTFNRPKKFVGLWIHYVYNVSLWLLYVGVLLAGTVGPTHAIQRGLVVTLPGKLAMGLIIICTLIAAISVMLALGSVGEDEPRKYSRYY